MTEIERIIKEGTIKENFLEPEVICDFYVDQQRKKIWAIEIDLLKEIDRVCKKYNLRYFLMWGSLIGAVRHKGFIPWDDDLDIAMPRKDYEILMSHSDDFVSPYFLQTPFTDDGYFYAHAKLRNTNTTALDYPFLFQGFNLGICIDILPLDYISEDNGCEVFHRIGELISENNIAMRLTHPYLNERDKVRVSSFKGGDPMENLDKITSLACQEVTSSKVSIMMTVVYGYDRHTWNASDFESFINIDFYGLQTFIPCNYDNILKSTYGDYSKFPPLEKRGTWHSNLFFDPDIPYKVSLDNWESIYDKDNPNTVQMTNG